MGNIVSLYKNYNIFALYKKYNIFTLLRLNKTTSIISTVFYSIILLLGIYESIRKHNLIYLLFACCCPPCFLLYFAVSRLLSFTAGTILNDTIYINKK